MILQALYQLAQHEGLMADPDYEPKPVAYLLRIGKDGRLIGKPESTRATSEPEPGSKRKPRPVPRMFRVPLEPSGRTVNIKPCFLWGNAQYVVAHDLAKPERAIKAAKSFRDLVGRCAAATADEGVLAVLKFLEDSAAGRQHVELPEDCKSNDLFAFVYQPGARLENELVTDRAAVRRWWAAERHGDQDATDGQHQRPRKLEGKGAARCLVTGLPVGKAGLFDSIEKLPGAQARAGLVSFNAPAFESYGLQGNENAPISREAAQACATALNRLLDPAYPDPAPGASGPLVKRHLRLTPDTVVCFWASDRRSDAAMDAVYAYFGFEPDAAQVGDLYRSIWKGVPPRLDDPARFYALTISGAKGRAVIRDWFESTVGDVVANLAAHFRDLAIVRNTPSKEALPPHLPLPTLLESLAPPGRTRGEGIPAALSAALVRSALYGGPYPTGILTRAIERTRSESSRSEWIDHVRRDARAALIKAVLKRRSFPEATPDMDPSNTNPAYLLGRLMAVIERLQAAALGDVNASVVDHYFAAASATPRAVFTRLMKSVPHYKKKAADEDKTAGLAHMLDRLASEIMFHFPADEGGFPPHLDLSEQGLFILGYHHQRHWLWMSKEAKQEWESRRSAPAL